MEMRKRLRQLIPTWEMPSDPVKAVWWFLHWLLKLTVNFFWLLIIVGGIFEVVVNWRVGGPFNGIVSGLVTLLVGAIVWAALFVILLVVNFTTGVKQVINEAARMQQTLKQRNPYSPYTSFTQAEREPEGTIVEGSITDLDEERRKRR
jgi:hypothetical protein